MRSSMRLLTRRNFLKSVALGTAAASMPSVLFAAKKKRSTPFKFVQMTDTQLGFGGYQHDVKTFVQAVNQINVLNPDFVFICGDLVNASDDKSFADFKTIKAGFEASCYCVPGNHDVGNVPTVESLKRYRKIIGKDYYFFEYMGYAFVSVNTQLWKSPLKVESEKHDKWFESVLKASLRKKHPIFVIAHYPLYMDKLEEPEQYHNLPIAKRKELLALFEKYGVVAMLTGHTHKLVVNDHKGIQLVSPETTSVNVDKRPLGFRVWHVEGTRPFKHEFVPLSL